MVPELKPLLRQTGFALRTFCVALLCMLPIASWAELAVIVNPQNPVEDLSAREVTKLFLGRLRMYPGTDLETEVIDQQEDQPAFRDFYQQLVRMNQSKLMRYRASYLFSGQGNLPTEVSDDAEVKRYVASHINAIGYIDISAVDDSVRVVHSVSSK
jgi:ABC-type phosphate transport system substrate-binding protein